MIAMSETMDFLLGSFLVLLVIFGPGCFER